MSTRRKKNKQHPPINTAWLNHTNIPVSPQEISSPLNIDQTFLSPVVPVIATQSTRGGSEGEVIDEGTQSCESDAQSCGDKGNTVVLPDGQCGEGECGDNPCVCNPTNTPSWQHSDVNTPQDVCESASGGFSRSEAILGPSTAIGDAQLASSHEHHEVCRTSAAHGNPHTTNSDHEYGEESGDSGEDCGPVHVVSGVCGQPAREGHQYCGDDDEMIDRRNWLPSVPVLGYRVEPKKTSKGYELPAIDGSMKNGHPRILTYPRVTSFTKSLKDTSGLSHWNERAVMIGTANNNNIISMIRQSGISTVDRLNGLPYDTVSRLNNMVEAAKRQAGTHVPSQWGTLMHAWVEWMFYTHHAHCMSLRQTIKTAPPIVRPWLSSIRVCLEKNHLEPLPYYYERTVYVPGTGCVGTFDFFVRDHAGVVYVADLKTTSHLSYDIATIETQLAQYAQASHILSLDGTHWEELTLHPHPHVGIVLNIPRLSPWKECRAYSIDLDRGYRTINAILHARQAMTYASDTLNSSVMPTLLSPSS